MTTKEKVQKLTHREHILHSPDTYVGSVEPTTDELWYYDGENKKMKKSNLTYVPGEYKLYDEIVVNSVDQYIRLGEMHKKDNTLIPVKNIKINVDIETGVISVYNDGEGISVEDSDHKDEKTKKFIKIPELIFGNLLTSTNYDKQEIKHVGGKNGYGAKLANIYSLEFTIETVDKQLGKKYIQTFYDNMTRKDKPKLTSYKSKPYTKITYKPEYSRFKSEGLTQDMMTIMEKRAYDIAAYTDTGLNVYFNGKKIECNNFEKYINLYIGNKQENTRIHEKINDRWEIAAAMNPEEIFDQVSFVNGIHTSKGGKHVDYIVNQLCKKLSEYIKKKAKVEVKPNYIREILVIFIKCTIDNPSFTSQTKETLSTPVNQFGSKCEINNKFIDKLAKSGVMERVLEIAVQKDNKSLKKLDGKKQTRLKGIPKLDDANFAGTKKSKECTIIFTEGDSAKATALAGLAVVGRDRYGVFPLKGKVLNVDDIKNLKKIMQNAEINNIIKIMGLETNKKYTSVDSLRYGSVLLFTDQDEDGSHIKGLLFNLFKTLWPSLFNLPGFLKSLNTPVVKAKSGKKIKEFYSVKDFEQWRETNQKGWHCKYYKGLGTSTPAESRDYFRDMNKNIITYTNDGDEDLKALDLAFSKNENSSDHRKEWLCSYDRNDTLDYNKKKISMRDFVNKDLKHFSFSDNARSIPNLVDGLKTSQRKVLFTALLRNLNKEIRVAQFAGSVSELSAYHHGEASLYGTITNMAQDYVGSNNINLFDPIGQFGSRLNGGKDAAQPRYIHTKLSEITKQIFNQQDTPLLENRDDDGIKVEPYWYVPIIPMILVNGCSGIGTGWSTSIPCYNPLDIIKNINNILDDKEELNQPLIPWYRGFKGSINKISLKSYESKGLYHFESDDKLVITELPVGVWTDKYKEHLESLTYDSKADKKKQDKQVIRYYTSQCTDSKVHFEIHFIKEMGLEFKYDVRRLEKVFKLSSSLTTTNMVLHDDTGNMRKMESVEEILKYFTDIRLDYYQKRKEYQLGELEKEINTLKIKIRFIMDFIESRLIINNKSKADIIEQLEKMEYPKKDNEYDYLLRMPIYNLTKEKIDEFNELLNNKKTDFDNLTIKTPKDLWKCDLDALKKYLIKNKYNSSVIKIKKIK